MASTVFRQGAWITAMAASALWLWTGQVAAQGIRPAARDPAGRAERAQELTAHGQRLVAAGDPGSAVWYLREALRIEPAFAPAAVILADVYVARGEASAALDVLNEGVTRAPSHAPLWLRLSRVLLSLNAEGDAMEALREGLRRDPENPELLAELVQHSLRRGEWLRALTAERALRSTRTADSHTLATKSDAPSAVDPEDALRVLVGTSDRARGLHCEAGMSPVRRALAGCLSRR